METVFAEVREQAAAESEYRPFSGLAVAGFVLGCLSVAAFFAPPLWMVAGVAIVVNLAAWRQVSGGQRQGARLCRVGMALAIFFLTAAVVVDTLRDWHAVRQAQRVGDDWVAAIRGGNLETAHQMSIEPYRRFREAAKMSPGDMKQRYTEVPILAVDCDTFRGLVHVKEILSLSADAATSPAKVRTFMRDNYREFVELEYEFHGGEQNEPRVVVVPLIRQREHAPFLSGWLVDVRGPNSR